MEVIFCGGAGEVGAACYLLIIDGKRILLDCGVRMDRGRDPLPDLRLIQDAGGIDAICVSHAHLDHTGALPIICREYPNARIYLTHASKDLVRVLLYDSLKIMGQSDGEIPVYAEAHVEQTLDRMVCYSPEHTFLPLGDTPLKVTFYQSGHILGAVCIYIQGREGNFFYSGDISMTNQHTVGKAMIPKLRPDAVLLESTYGDKLHANRQLEEERLTDIVAQTAARNGKVLIPAFALGRAQEVILILKRAISKGKMPKIKIYVDGMVREVCRMYRLNPNYLRPVLAKRIFKGSDIFFNDWVEPVTDKAMREELVKSTMPCCILSSSGMLTGGPSAWYAEKLAGDPLNHIAITGYQDEEAPGRRLLDAMDQPFEERMLPLGSRRVPLLCSIGRYSLSAHADRGELMGLMHVLSPKQVFLIHGEAAGRKSLGSILQHEIRGRIFLPENGEHHEIWVGKARKQIYPIKTPSMQRQGMPEESQLKDIWDHLQRHGAASEAFSPEALLRIYSGLEGTEDECRILFSLLAASPYFEQDARRPFLLRPISPDAAAEVAEDRRMEANQMLTLAEAFFPPEAGLYRKGARVAEGIALLYFSFPRSARIQYGEALKAFSQQTGWQVEMNGECNLEAAEDLIMKLLPEGVSLDGRISYFRDGGYFKIRLKGEAASKAFVQQFQERTGLELRIEEGEANHPSEPVAAQPGQMEQNQAMQHIRETFTSLPVHVYRMSLKRDEGGPHIELTFISPAVGARYRAVLDRLEQQVRWRITVNPSANQNEILKTARCLLEGYGLTLMKNPSYLGIEGKVRVTLMPCDDPEGIFLQAAADFLSMTGCSLERW